MKKQKKWKRRVSSKLRGSYGETDFEKRTITINKTRHKSANARKDFPKQDRSLINTIVHEETHRIHPRMTEKVVRKKARASVARMSKKQKSKWYSKYEK